MISSLVRRVLGAAIVVLLVIAPSFARATVYRWKGGGGVVMLSNDPEDVPAEQRASAETFTAKPGPPRAPDGGGAPAVADRDVAGSDPYGRGYAAGLASAEREVALAEQLARSVLAAIPQQAPAPIIVEQAAPPGPAAMPYGVPPYYGYGYGYAYDYAGAYLPYPLLTFGFSSPFGAGPRFFASHAREHHLGRSFGPGHMGLAHHGFGRMR